MKLKFLPCVLVLALALGKLSKSVADRSIVRRQGFGHPLQQDDEYLPKLRVTSAYHWPTAKVGPYDWMYYRVDVPEQTNVVSIELKKIRWQDESGDQTGPLVCFRKGGPPLPVGPSPAMDIAAIDGTRLLHNNDPEGSCAWFEDDVAVNVTSDEVLAGSWQIGFFSITNSSRTQSQMIPRGPVYHFGLHVVTYACNDGDHVNCPNCDCFVNPLPPYLLPPPPPGPFYPFDEPPPNPYDPTPGDEPPPFEPPAEEPPPEEPPLAAGLPGFFSKAPSSHPTSAADVWPEGSRAGQGVRVVASTHSPEAGPTQNATSVSEKAPVMIEPGRWGEWYEEGLQDDDSSSPPEPADLPWSKHPHQCFAYGENWKYYSIDITGPISQLEIEAYREESGEFAPAPSSPDDPSVESSIVVYARLGAVPTETEYYPLPILAPQHGLWYIGVPGVDTLTGERTDAVRNRTYLHDQLGQSGDRCFMLRWRIEVCPPGRGEYACQWDIMALERIIPAAMVESPMDAAYLPATQAPPSNIADAWFPLSVGDNSLAASKPGSLRAAHPGRKPSAWEALGHPGGGEPGLKPGSGGEREAAGSKGSPVAKYAEPGRPVVQKDWDDLWGYFAFQVPNGLSGSTLSIDVMVPPAVNQPHVGPHLTPLANKTGGEVQELAAGSESMGLAVERTAYTQIVGRFEGVPSDSEYDIRTEAIEWKKVTMTAAPDAADSDSWTWPQLPKFAEAGSLSPNSSAPPRLSLGGDGAVKLDMPYPAEGLWFFAVHFFAVDMVTSGEGGQQAEQKEEPGRAATQASLSGGGVGATRVIVDVKVRVLMHGCPQGCNGNGKCLYMEEGSQTQLVSYCYCDRSYGGFDCSEQLLTPEVANRHIGFLVASNLAAVLPSVWTIQHKAYAEWVVYTTGGIASALYHSCDSGGWCAANYSTLQFTDFFLSFIAVVITFIYMADSPPGPKMTALVTFTIVDAIIARDRATSGANIYLVAAMGIVGLLMGWVLEFARERRLWTLQSRQEVFRPESWREYWTDVARWREWLLEVRAFLVRVVARYRKPYLIGGFACLFAAKLNWAFETASTYWIWHSLWHVSMYTAAFLFLCSTEEPREGGREEQPNSPDSAAGIQGTRLTPAPLESIHTVQEEEDEERTLLRHYGEGSTDGQQANNQRHTELESVQLT